MSRLRASKTGCDVAEEQPVPVVYDGITHECGFRADLLVNRSVVVELKAKSAIHPVDKAQTLSHLRLMRLQVGLLINFHEVKLIVGLHRFVNQYQGPKPKLLTSPLSASSATPRLRLPPPLKLTDRPPLQDALRLKYQRGQGGGFNFRTDDAEYMAKTIDSSVGTTNAWLPLQGPVRLTSLWAELAPLRRTV
jgi:GxxExxY protein